MDLNYNWWNKASVEEKLLPTFFAEVTIKNLGNSEGWREELINDFASWKNC